MYLINTKYVTTILNSLLYTKLTRARFTCYPVVVFFLFVFNFLLFWQNHKLTKLRVSNQNASVSVAVSFRWARWANVVPMFVRFRDWWSLQMGHCFITKSKTYQSPTALFEPTKISQLKERPYHENSFSFQMVVRLSLLRRTSYILHCSSRAHSKIIV